MKHWLWIGILCALGPMLFAEPYFLLDSQTEWEEALYGTAPEQNKIKPAMPHEWTEYMFQREEYLVEGELPAPSIFLPPELHVYDGGGGGGGGIWPEEACLVMAWGEPSLPENNYASAWKFEYGLDPDLRNCTLKLTVHPPAAIVMVSFGLTDINGNQCSWTWNNPANIPTAPPATTITINTANVPGLGLNSSNPPAAAFAFNPNFDMSQVASVFISETFHNTPGVFPPPVPGGSQFFYWNAWDNMQVTPNNGGGGGLVNTKSFVKYSQPPVEMADGIILGWDEPSVYIPPRMIMADDFECKDERPITDIHWWGSFQGWTQPTIPAWLLPKAFHIGIWTDVPKGADPQFPGFSHPGTLVWENYCDNFVWNFAGYDKDPRGQMENEACFQFNQLLSQDEWFRQPPLDDPQQPRIYWLSIAAIYDPQYPPMYPWGWKTREHFFMDDAVRILQVRHPDGSLWPPNPLQVGKSVFAFGQPLEFPIGVSWDLAFELTTNQAPPCSSLSADLNRDCKVDMPDLAIFAQQWLMTE
ncbi:MAG TPA: hypothetical protein PKY88_11080 [Anaerohalosphaeraceae bacterium]|nr:hypothetical protein [Anaerohalosphaeraceae bacterium]